MRTITESQRKNVAGILLSAEATAAYDLILFHSIRLRFHIDRASTVDGIYEVIRKRWGKNPDPSKSLDANLVDLAPSIRAVSKTLWKAKKNARAEAELGWGTGNKARVRRVRGPRRKAMPGEMSPTKKIKEEFYSSWEWQTLRMDRLKLSGRVCQCCGAAPGQKTTSGVPVRIVVDHIKPIAFYWSLRLDLANTQVLCDECNQGKGAWDETDWRTA